MLKVIFGIIFSFNVCHADNIFEAGAKDFMSPLKPEARGYLQLGIATSAFMYIFFKDDLILAVAHETHENKPLGEYALYGDYGGQLVPNALYASGMYASYLFTDDKDYRRFASQMFRATLYSGLATTILKTTIHETRPNGIGNESFPSGHTTTAFAFASIVAMNHKWYWAVPAFAFASFVGYSRINDNKHYLHDVTVGATIGLVYGMGIYYTDLDQEVNHEAVAKAPSLFVTPTLLQDGFGFFLVKTF